MQMPLNSNIRLVIISAFVQKFCVWHDLSEGNIPMVNRRLSKIITH